jgi:hypothetical protein
VGLVAVACGAGDPSPSPAKSAPAGRDAASDAPAPPAATPAPPTPVANEATPPAAAPGDKPRVFIADPLGNSPEVTVAEDARLFHRVGDRGEWISPPDLADPELVARRLGDATTAPTERGSYIMSGSTKLASLHPASQHVPFNVALRAAALATGRGARVGQSFADLLALVPELKCSPEWGEGYQQLNCDMPDGWSAIFPAAGRNFKDLDTIDSNEQARKLVGRNRLSLLQWSGRVSQ